MSGYVQTPLWSFGDPESEVLFLSPFCLGSQFGAFGLQPYKPAAIPQVTPLPKAGSTGAILSTRLLRLEESEAAHRQVAEEAERGLLSLKEEEVESRESVARVNEKLQFFERLEEFVIALALLFEEKVSLTFFFGPFPSCDWDRSAHSP